MSSSNAGFLGHVQFKTALAPFLYEVFPISSTYLDEIPTKLCRGVFCVSASNPLHLMELEYLPGTLARSVFFCDCSAHPLGKDRKGPKALFHAQKQASPTL
jgi:hypothetical protein